MKTLIIKQNCNGSIHDISNQHCDREIDFPSGSKYAVVLAAYYGGKGYTTHKTEAAAIKASNDNANYSHSIIDRSGSLFVVDDDRII